MSFSLEWIDQHLWLVLHRRERVYRIGPTALALANSQHYLLLRQSPDDVAPSVMALLVHLITRRPCAFLVPLVDGVNRNIEQCRNLISREWTFRFSAAASPDSGTSTGAISVGGQSDLGQDHSVAIAPSPFTDRRGLCALIRFRLQRPRDDVQQLTPQPLGADPEIWTIELLEEQVMQTDATSSVAAEIQEVQAGSVVALWRYPVKSMMGEELNSSEVTDRGLLGDRQFAIVDRATGKVGGAKNPRKWGNFFDFRASYAEAPKHGARISPVRITLPDGEVVSKRSS